MEYSTSGVFPVLTFLARTPSASSSRSCSVKTFCAASGTSRRNSPKRRGPPFSANKMIGFHLPSITSTVVLTRHSFNRITPRKVAQLCLLGALASLCQEYFYIGKHSIFYARRTNARRIHPL